MSIVWKDFTLTIPIKVKKIISVKIVQKCNEHAVAKITVLLEQGQNLEDIYAMNEKTSIVLHNKNSDKKPILFSGILMGLNVSVQHDMCIAELVVKSHSISMDLKKKRRSFQYEKNLYQSIFQQILETDYQGDFIDTISKAKAQERVIIQYDETDWEFLLRLASQLNTIIIPDVLSNKPKIWIGLPQGEKHKQEVCHYQVIRQTDDYMFQMCNGKEKGLLDFTYLQIETQQDYEMGDTILCQGFYFVIAEKEMALERGKMVFRYKLCKKEGIFTNIYYNTVFRGLSIDGKVLDVKEDCLKVHLSIDEKQEIEKCHWFQYNTPYTTEGQTGFYVMPQVGDSVKLYSPKEDESQAYIKTVNRTDGNINGKTKDVATKRFGTIHKREMVLSPTSIDFIAAEEKSSINMNDCDGITLTGSVSIKINTENLMRFEAEKIIIQGSDRIMATTPKANVIVDEIMHFKA